MMDSMYILICLQMSLLGQEQLQSAKSCCDPTRSLSARRIQKDWGHLKMVDGRFPGYQLMLQTALTSQGTSG